MSAVDDAELDLVTRPTPPARCFWSKTGLLMGPPNDWVHQFRLEGTPVRGGTMERVGHAGTRIDAMAMAEWLVHGVKLYAAVDIVQFVAVFEAQP